jgi:hypothetical protein
MTADQSKEVVPTSAREVATPGGGWHGRTRAVLRYANVGGEKRLPFPKGRGKCPGCHGLLGKAHQWKIPRYGRTIRLGPDQAAEKAVQERTLFD